MLCWRKSGISAIQDSWRIYKVKPRGWILLGFGREEREVIHQTKGKMRDRFWITSRPLMENNYMTDSQPGVHPGRDHLQVYPPLPEDSQVMEVEEQVQATPQQRAPMVPMPTAPPPTPAGTGEENTAPILPEIRPRQRQDLADTLLIPTPMVGIVIQPSVWNSQLRKSPLPAPGEGTQLTSTLRNGEMPPTQNLNMSVSFMDEEEEDS